MKCTPENKHKPQEEINTSGEIEIRCSECGALWFFGADKLIPESIKRLNALANMSDERKPLLHQAVAQPDRHGNCGCGHSLAEHMKAALNSYLCKQCKAYCYPGMTQQDIDDLRKV